MIAPVLWLTNRPRPAGRNGGIGPAAQTGLRAARVSAVAFNTAAVVPILRIFDQARAREFYLDYLGATLDWEHRFSPESPLYLQVSRGPLVLHLSEHHGDGTPGTVVYIAATGVRELHAELRAKNYPYLMPGLEESPGSGGVHEGVCLTLTDPFGNQLRIDERAEAVAVAPRRSAEGGQ
jgi:hypothetical protein